MDRRVGELADPLRQVEVHPVRDTARERGDDDLVVVGGTPDLTDEEQRIGVDAEAPLALDALVVHAYQDVLEPLVRVAPAVRADGHQEGAAQRPLFRPALERVDELVGAGGAVRDHEQFRLPGHGSLLVSDDTDDVTPSGVPPCPVEPSVECHVASVRRARAARITVTIPAMPAELNGARVLLTGATGGIGNAIAEELHSRGAHVLATGRRREALEELDAEPLVADLSERDAVTSLIDRAGRVDVLVANAALPGSGKLDSYSPEEIDRAIDVNLRAPIQLTRALVPPMVERGSGHVVLISSLSGKMPAAYSSVFSATKFGLRGFGLSLNDELHDTPVGVSIVAPGFIRDAGMFAESGVELPRGTGTRTPADVAKAVVSAIESGRQEIDVAPLSFRVGARVSGLAPGLVTGLQRKLGSHKVGAEMGEGQRAKR